MERLFSLNELGDSNPSKLMENVLALLGSGDALFLFVQLFLLLLPLPRVRTKELVEEADCIFLASCQYAMRGVLPAASQAAAQRRAEKDLCFSHRHFGTRAKRCIPPCSFPTQGNARADDC